MKLKLNFLFAATLLVGISCNSSKKTTEATPKSETMIQAPFENTEWQLVEVLGKPVNEYGELTKTPTISFDSKEHRFSGNAGCNILNGSYKILPGNRIQFGQVMSTMMACPDMKLEDIVSKTLPTLNTYMVYDNGDLIFTTNKMAPVLRFVKSQK